MVLELLRSSKEGGRDGLPGDDVRPEGDSRNISKYIVGNVGRGGLSNNPRWGHQYDIEIGNPLEVELIDPNTAPEGPGDGTNTTPEMHSSWGLGERGIVNVGLEPIWEVSVWHLVFPCMVR